MLLDGFLTGLCTCLHLYGIWKEFRILAEMLLHMQTAEIHELEQLAVSYHELLAQCLDAIDQLTNYKPDGFEIAFLIRGVKAFSMPVPSTEKEFALCFFISWRQYYQRKLEDTTAAVWALKRAV